MRRPYRLDLQRYEKKTKCGAFCFILNTFFESKKSIQKNSLQEIRRRYALTFPAITYSVALRPHNFLRCASRPERA